MTLDEINGALAHLPDDAQITITVRKADLAKALERRAGGPAVMTTAQASEIFGYSTILRSATQGRATYTMEFKHYSEAPKHVTDAIITAKAK